MRNKKVHCRLLSLSVASLLLAGACGSNPPTPEDVERQAFDDLRSEVRVVVEDPTREAIVVALVDRLQSDYSRIVQVARSRRQDLRELNADYDATRKQFSEYLVEYSDQLEQVHKQFRETHRSFVGALSADEWDALSKYNSKSMTTLAKNVSSI